MNTTQQKNLNSGSSSSPKSQVKMNTSLTKEEKLQLADDLVLPTPFEEDTYVSTLKSIAQLNDIELTKALTAKTKEGKFQLPIAVGKVFNRMIEQYRELKAEAEQHKAEAEQHKANAVQLEQEVEELKKANYYLENENELLKSKVKVKSKGKAKKQPAPPPPKEYYLNRKIDEKMWGFTEQDFKDYLGSFTKEKMMEIVLKGTTKDSIFTHEERKRLFEKPTKKTKGGGHSKEEKVERSKNADKNCSIPTHLRCQHCVPVQGTNYKQFQRCSRKCSITLAYQGKYREVCVTHYNQLKGIADNQARPASDFKSKLTKEVDMTITGSWHRGGIGNLINKGGLGGFYDNTQEQMAERYKQISSSRKKQFKVNGETGVEAYDLTRYLLVK